MRSSKTSAIGYLTSQYPAPSHTFIRREIGQLRSHGLEIRTYSFRPLESGLENQLDRDEQNQTYYVLEQGIFTYVAAHLRALFSHPIRYLGTFGRAFGHRVPGLRALIWAIFHFAESIILADRLRRDGIAHLHNHFANSGATVGMLAASFAQIPWSMTLHGISETDYPAGLLLARKIEAARFVACVSWFGRAQAMRISTPDQWHKFHIVRCGVDLGALPERVPASENNKSKQVICVARLSSEKGHIGLFQAFKGLIEKGHEAELVLVGDGPEQGVIETTARDLGLADKVRFLGRKSEPETLSAIAQADLLVLPSFMEGLPVVLMEAMALGVPVVASRVAGVPELIEHGENGLLFHPADWEGLEAALEAMLSDDEKARKMAAVAKDKTLTEFAIEKAVAPLPALFTDDANDL